MLLSHIPNIPCECKNLKIELKLPNMMRMEGAGLVEKDVFAKTDPYKCLKNVAIDCHQYCRILENGLQMLRALTNAVTNNVNALQTPY